MAVVHYWHSTYFWSEKNYSDLLTIGSVVIVDLIVSVDFCLLGYSNWSHFDLDSDFAECHSTWYSNHCLCPDCDFDFQYFAVVDVRYFAMIQYCYHSASFEQHYSNFSHYCCFVPDSECLMTNSTHSRPGL